MISLIRPTSQVIVCTARMYVLCTYKRSYAHIIITKCIFSLITLTRQATSSWWNRTKNPTGCPTNLPRSNPIARKCNRAKQFANQHRKQNDTWSATNLRHCISKPNQLLMSLLVIICESLCSLCWQNSLSVSVNNLHLVLITKKQDDCFVHNVQSPNVVTHHHLWELVFTLLTK